MKDSNFLKEHNARHLWHPMAHPGDMQANPPTIITDAHGTRIRDIDGNEVVDAVAGSGMSISDFRATPSRMPSLPSSTVFRTTPPFVAPRVT